MESIRTIDDLKIGMCAPVDRETPLIEVCFHEKIIMDFSCKNDSPNNGFEILFHNDISGIAIELNLLNQVIKICLERLKKG